MKGNISKRKFVFFFGVCFLTKSKVGEWVYYYENGMKKSEGNYTDGKWVVYYEDGQISREGNYKDGERDGKWVWYYEDGQIEKEENYVDGKPRSE